MASTRRRLALLAAPAALLAGLAFAHSAGATVYCVDVTGGDCDVISPDPQVANPQAALTAAAGNPGPDRVRLGVATYVGGAPTGFSYSPGDNSPVEIIGSGQAPGGTNLTMPTQVASGNRILHVQGTGGTSSVSDLRVTIPTATATEQYRGIEMLSGNLMRVTVSGGDFNGFGIVMNDGQVIDSTIDLARQGVNGGTRALELPATSGAASLVRNVTSTADTALLYQNAGAGTLTVERSTLNGSANGSALDVREGSATASSTLAAINGAGGRVVTAGNPNDFDLDVTNLTLEGLTIIGNGPTSTGINVFAKDPNGGVNDTTTVNLGSSIIDQAGTSIARAADNGDTANVTSAFSNYDSSTQTSTNDPNSMAPTGFGAITETTTPTNLPPMFGANFHLLAGSPLIDIGSPMAPAPGTLDIDGDPRVVLGVPACAARRDIGADEFVPAVPVAPPASCNPVVVPTQTASENPECATLRAKLKRAKSKRKKRKIRKRLRQLGC